MMILYIKRNWKIGVTAGNSKACSPPTEWGFAYTDKAGYNEMEEKK